MTYQQYRAVRRLVHSYCNYDQGNCLLLDDGEMCLPAGHFLLADLPLDKELYVALLPAPAVGRRRCRECKRIFTPPRQNTLYCPDCAVKRAKRSKRDWVKKKRAGASKKYPLKTRLYQGFQSRPR